jgi:hypothetical protein
VVTSFAPPGTATTAEFVDRCRQWGYIIGGQSGYLAEHRLVQIATMGAVTREDCQGLFERMKEEGGRMKEEALAAALIEG